VLSSEGPLQQCADSYAGVLIFVLVEATVFALFAFCWGFVRLECRDPRTGRYRMDTMRAFLDSLPECPLVGHWDTFYGKQVLLRAGGTNRRQHACV